MLRLPYAPLAAHCQRMKAFNCQLCSQPTYFENDRCLSCGSQLGYLPDVHSLVALAQHADGLLYPLANNPRNQGYRVCLNTSEWHACNWLIAADSDAVYCRSCCLNEIIPDLSVASNVPLWTKLEAGKRRLLYSLLRLGLPVLSKAESPEKGLAFRFLKDISASFRENNTVLTGHSKGIITINLAEADDAERERRRLDLNEVYRTVLGHFRHESGHHYWQLLVANSAAQAQFRQLFGDERVDYDTAIGNHYGSGPKPGWESRYITAYASSHPLEDWAESWAHFVTIVDSLETATEFGVVITGNGSKQLFAPLDSYWSTTFDELLEQWLPLTYAVNSINRSSGHGDLYPFVLCRPAIQKLRFVQQVVRNARFNLGQGAG
jgi:hypothetical protein